MIKIKSLIITVIFIFITQHAYTLPELNIKTGILIDYHSDKILYELDPDISIYPASMTKIMTTIVVFDLLKKNKLSLDDKFTVTEKAWRMSQSGYSSMFIMVNDEVSVDDLLKGIIITSGNDACIAIAEGIAGTEEDFADIMNEKAKEIGMVDTNFANSSGINNPDNYSTVRDIALMSKYLIKNYPVYYELYKEKEFTWDRTGGDPITQSNRNGLLFKNIGADGIKTGYLAVEKYSLASTVIKKERRLISVASGFNSASERTRKSIKLLNWGFRNTETYEVAKKNETVFDLQTWLGKKKIVKAVTKEDLYITLGKKEANNFYTYLEYKGPIKAPIKKDQKIGFLKVYQKDKLIKNLPIYSSENIKKINFFKSVFTSINYMIWGDA
jgi:D-alanyl-D-alanine carboxypeptidase (penicillin-binding protein 5/6)